MMYTMLCNISHPVLKHPVITCCIKCYVIDAYNVLCNRICDITTPLLYNMLLYNMTQPSRLLAQFLLGLMTPWLTDQR